MPEGPEIWRTADKLTDALVNRRVEDIRFAFNELKPHEKQLVGASVVEIEPRGKAIITRFSNDLNIYSHNQLYGKWFIKKVGDSPNTNRSLRLTISNDKYTAYLYSASEIEVLDDNELKEHSYLKKLGPDLLHPQTSFENVLQQYKNERFQNRKLSSLLLDQGFLSGIGNYLRSEIMFYAQADPFIKLGDCADNRKNDLAQASIKLTGRSYKTGGLTTDPDLIEALKREGKTKKEYRHYVYKRNDRRCYRCGSVIKSDQTGGRTVYFCPECQL